MAINRTLAEASGLSPSDVEVLLKMSESLPILADLCHADLLLYCRGNQPNTAFIVSEAKPLTVSSLYEGSLVGKQVGRKNEPVVFQVLNPGRLNRNVSRTVDRGMPVIQEVRAIRNQADKVIAALSFETSMREHERLRRKHSLFRKALLQLQDMVLRGQLEGCADISPPREHSGIMVVEQAGRVLYVNGIAENMYRKLGLSDALVGSQITELGTNESAFFDCLQKGCYVEQEIQERQSIWVKKAFPLLSQEPASWFPNRSARKQQWTGAILVIHDITEERLKEQALRIKAAMIQEIHHRVKNNLQTIAALLRMQARRSSHPEVAQLVQESVNRILSVAVVHEFLSHDEDSVINIRDVAQRILSEVTQGILDPSKKINLSLEGTAVYLPAQQATSCALIINELLQNAVEHAFIGRDQGRIVLTLEDTGKELVVQISDDGIGLPHDFDVEIGGHLGLQIIRTLVREDLKGRFEIANGNGVSARVVLMRSTAAPV